LALNAVTLVLVSQFNDWLTARLGPRKTVRAASVCQGVLIALLLMLTSAGVDRLEFLAAMGLVVYGLNGVIVPSTFVLAMEGHAPLAGSASTLIRMLNFAGGASATAFVAPLAVRPCPRAARFSLGEIVLQRATASRSQDHIIRVNRRPRI
jgi:DHA1 family bicyclomycin/chloramphenicol resistance-like MFS transporter